MTKLLPKFYTYYLISMTAIYAWNTDLQYLYEFIDTILTFMILICVWCYSHESMILNKKFWRIFVPACAAWDIYIRYLGWDLFEGSFKQYMINLGVDFLLILVPMYYMATSFAFSNIYKAKE